jgi:hypothetical protein
MLFNQLAYALKIAFFRCAAYGFHAAGNHAQ